MRKDRLVSLSDGIIAGIITIALLEMKVPRGADLGALRSTAVLRLVPDPRIEKKITGTR